MSGLALRQPQVVNHRSSCQHVRASRAKNRPANFRRQKKKPTHPFSSLVDRGLILRLPDLFRGSPADPLELAPLFFSLFALSSPSQWFPPRRLQWVNTGLAGYTALPRRTIFYLGSSATLGLISAPLCSRPTDPPLRNRLDKLISH